MGVSLGSPRPPPGRRSGLVLYGGLVRQRTRLGPSSTRGARPPRGVMGLLPFSLARPSTPGGRVRSHSRPPGVFAAWARGSFRGVVSGTTHRGLVCPGAWCPTPRPPRGPWVCSTWPPWAPSCPWARAAALHSGRSRTCKGTGARHMRPCARSPWPGRASPHPRPSRPPSRRVRRRRRPAGRWCRQRLGEDHAVGGQMQRGGTPAHLHARRFAGVGSWCQCRCGC